MGLSFQWPLCTSEVSAFFPVLSVRQNVAIYVLLIQGLLWFWMSRSGSCFLCVCFCALFSCVQDIWVWSGKLVFLYCWLMNARIYRSIARTAKSLFYCFLPFVSPIPPPSTGDVKGSDVTALEWLSVGAGQCLLSWALWLVLQTRTSSSGHRVCYEAMASVQLKSKEMFKQNYVLHNNTIIFYALIVCMCVCVCNGLKSLFKLAGFF